MLLPCSRGQVKSNYKQTGVIHTTNSSKNLSLKLVESNKPLVEAGDWLIHRVSRNLIESLREYKGDKVPHTDCIIRLRANDKELSNQHFFL
ncbi:hypothetical protein CWC18_20835 [Pseudoalteromonas aurantia]|nr:hypothetical protein CWC18_20835 [Pseudoalteromonas aurantia]